MPDKYEKEIEELLASLGEFKPRKRSFSDRVMASLGRWQYRWQRFVSGLVQKRLNPDHLMVYGIILIVIAYFLRFPIVGKYIGIAGILLFFTGFLLAMTMGRRYNNEQKIWRGRVIQFEEHHLGLKIRYWLRRLFKGK